MTWWRCVADDDVIGTGKNRSTRFLSKTQAKADAVRIEDKHGVETRVMKDSEIPDDVTELFD